MRNVLYDKLSNRYKKLYGPLTEDQTILLNAILNRRGKIYRFLQNYLTNSHTSSFYLFLLCMGVQTENRDFVSSWDSGPEYYSDELGLNIYGFRALRDEFDEIVERIRRS